MYHQLSACIFAESGSVRMSAPPGGCTEPVSSIMGSMVAIPAARRSLRWAGGHTHREPA